MFASKFSGPTFTNGAVIKGYRGAMAASIGRPRLGASQEIEKLVSGSIGAVLTAGSLLGGGFLASKGSGFWEASGYVMMIAGGISALRYVTDSWAPALAFGGLMGGVALISHFAGKATTKSRGTFKPSAQ